MISTNLTLEKVVQVYDKTRLNASLSFATQEDITDVEIKPSATDDYISVYNSNSDKWYLDWAYETDGPTTVTVRITGTVNTATRTFDIVVLDEDDDALFSSDQDIFPHEPNIHEYLPRGKNSFLYVHRASQQKILDHLDERRIWKNDGSRYVKADIAAITDDEIRDQFRRWSTHQTIATILESVQVSNTDIFQEKKIEHLKLMEAARDRAALRLDQDGDSVIDEYRVDVRSLRMVRA